MYGAMPRRLSGRAYMTYTVRYAARLYPSLQLGDVPMALSPFLQSPTLGSGKLGIAHAGRNTCGSALSRVAPLCKATPSASMPAKALPGVAAPRNAVASACPSGP